MPCSLKCPVPHLNTLYLRPVLVSVVAVTGHGGSLQATGMPALLLVHLTPGCDQRKVIARHISVQNQLPPGKNLSLLSVRLHPARKTPHLVVPNLSHRARGPATGQGPVSSNTLPIFSCHLTYCLIFIKSREQHFFL